MAQEGYRVGIEEAFTVVVLAPSDVAVPDEHGNDDITIGPG
jgi:hypothetical protein